MRRGLAKPILALTVAAVCATATLSHAASRSAGYSIHMLAKVPTLCALRDLSHIVILTRDTEYGERIVDHGRARFRVDCNVPYHLEIGHRATRWIRRGYLVPAAATLDADEMPALATSGAFDNDGAVTCVLSSAHHTAAPCRTSAHDPSLPVMPRAVGQIDVVEREVVAPQRFLSVGSDRIVAIELGGRH